MKRFQQPLILLLFALATISCGSRLKIASTTPTPSRQLSMQEQRLSDLYLQEALRHRTLEQHDAAFDCLSRVLAIDSLNAAALFVRSNYFVTLNDPVRALSHLQSATQIAPDNYWYLFGAANLSQQLNLNDEAVAYYQQLIARDPSNPELDYSLAEVYTNSGEIDKAIEALNRLEEKMGPMEIISLQKSRLYSAINQEEKANAEMDQLIAAFPNDIRYRLLMGDIAMEKSDLPRALAYYQAAKAIDPTDGLLQLALANYYNRVGEKESANLQIEAALRNNNLEIESKLNILKDYLKTLYLKKGGVMEADNLFQILLSSNPQKMELYSLYAAYLSTEKRFRESLDNLDIAVGLEPTNRDLWFQALDASFRLQDFKAANQLCLRASHYFPTEGRFYYYRSISLGVDSAYQSAIDVMKEGMVKMERNDRKFISGCYTQIADLYHQIDSMEACYDHYEKAIEVDPDNASALNNYAYFLSLEKERLGEAEKMSGRAVKLEPENSTYLDTYAWIYFQQGSLFLAKVYIETALRNGGDTSDVIVEHYGDILFHNGDLDKAILQWERALQLGSESQILRRKIETRSYLETPQP